MRMDAALMGQVAASARVYTWDGPWVSLGNSQRPETALVDPTMTRWVMRPTGGAAVLHGHDVTVGLSMQLAGSVKHAYRVASRPIIDALNAVGVAAVLAEDLRVERGGLHLADCFASISRNDIIDRRTLRKVCGCALRRTRDMILLQASIPAGEPLVYAPYVIIGGVPTPGPHIDPYQFRDELEKALVKNGY